MSSCAKSTRLVSNLLKKVLFGLYRALQLPCNMLLSIPQGDVAQLGERDNRTVEVRGSSPLISTATRHHLFLTIRIYLAIASNKQLGYNVREYLANRKQLWYSNATKQAR